MKRDELIRKFVIQWGQEGMYDKVFDKQLNDLINQITSHPEAEESNPAEEILKDFRSFFNTRYDKCEEAWKIEILYIDIRDFLKDNKYASQKQGYPVEFVEWLSLNIANDIISLGLPVNYWMHGESYSLDELYQYWQSEINK